MQQWNIKYSNGFKSTKEKIINNYLCTYVYSRKKIKQKYLIEE